MKLITSSRGENAMRFAAVFASVDMIFLIIFPIIFMPSANQGPLLGTLLLMPSFVIGIFVGVLVKPSKNK